MTSLRTSFSLGLLSGDTEAGNELITALFEDPAACKFEQQPAQKLTLIHELQEKGAKVAMIGDGLNDAGALQQSNVGIAVAESLATFTPSSDAILKGEALPLLPGFLRAARQTISLVYGTFFLSILYNLVGLAFALTGHLSPLVAAILMPLSSVTIVLVSSLGATIILRRVIGKNNLSLSPPHL